MKRFLLKNQNEAILNRSELLCDSQVGVAACATQFCLNKKNMFSVEANIDEVLTLDCRIINNNKIYDLPVKGKINFLGTSGHFWVGGTNYDSKVGLEYYLILGDF